MGLKLVRHGSGTLVCEGGRSHCVLSRRDDSLEVRERGGEIVIFFFLIVALNIQLTKMKVSKQHLSKKNWAL